ncbi:MAG: membrane protein insertase YidC [Pseudomonadales bacterium]|nr:membrane protein insertase YidC [Pseudomonadales bacterium]
MNVIKDLPRFALFAIIAGVVLMILKQWVEFSPRYDQAVVDRQQAINENLIDVESINYESEDNSTTIDSQDDDSVFDQPISSTASVAKNIVEAINTTNSARMIVVTTDTLRVTIDSQGGDIVEVALLKHLDSLEEGAEPLLLLEKSGVRTYTAQSGLTGPNGTDVKSTRARFHSLQSDYQMQGKEDLEVDLVFADPSGIRLTKRYTFRYDDYLIDVNYIVDNNSGSNWQTTFYSQISRDQSKDPGSDTAGFGMQSYLGAATTTADDPYKKISFKDIGKENFRNQYAGGWVAMIQHYFVSAWVPEPNATYNYYTKAGKSGLNIIGFHKAFEVEAGARDTIGAQFYVGPKYQYRLQKIAPHLDLTVDYGWLWWIAQPLYTLLYFFATGEAHIFGEVYDVFPGFGNWGFSIIMLTVVIKALFFRLSATSYRSMANMRRVQPKLLAVRERHANDKQAQSKAMMELYQKEKINPLGGCLPILVQMPVFIALYWALMESVELRHAPFIGWITDLSVMDPYFVLPLIMGTTMFLQQKMNPPPPDPMQAKIMQWMPVVFTLFFVFFPAGLVVYWVSNNILSISQQWYITRQIKKANS